MDETLILDFWDPNWKIILSEYWHHPRTVPNIHTTQGPSRILTPPEIIYEAHFHGRNGLFQKLLHWITLNFYINLNLCNLVNILFYRFKVKKKAITMIKQLFWPNKLLPFHLHTWFQLRWMLDHPFLHPQMWWMLTYVLMRIIRTRLICDALQDLVQFVQFKKREKHP